MPDLKARLSAALAERYVIEQELGSGGMATVYLARDLRHDRSVAVKVLKPELAASLGADRFLREIKVAAQLQHPHILPLHDSGEADDFLYYVMPYVKGQSLRERITQAGELPVPDAVSILREVVDALAHAHEQGVVHRDIKPDNIMLSGRHALVMDFGVAKAVSEATGRQALTTAGVALGTPSYMAPEQATADPNTDHRADIYAVGAVAYELLTGRPPFVAASPQMILAAHVTEAAEPVRKRREKVSPALESLVMRCLEKNPADRWQRAEEMLPHLDALATPSGGMTPTATVPVPAARPARKVLGGPAAWVGVALVVVAGVVGSRFVGRGDLVITTSNLRWITRAPGLEFQPAISPDGREVAYVEGPIGAPTVVIQSAVDVGTGAASRPLPGGTQQWFPRWAANGDKLDVLVCQRSGFFQGCNLRETSRLGGGVANAVAIPGRSDRNALSRAVLSPDGTRGAFASGDSLFTYRVGSNEVEVLGVQAVSPWGPHSLAWSPDGRWIAYVNGNPQWLFSGNQSSSSIWLISADGGEPVAVTREDHANLSPQWLPDSRHLLFASDRDGARALYVVAVSSRGPMGDPARVAGAEDAHSISVSRDGRRLAFAKFALSQNIWSAPITQGTPVRLSGAVRVTTENQVIEDHDLSPDGRWMAFDSDRRGTMAIYRMDLDAGLPALVIEAGGDLFGPRISPRGTEIAFYTGSGYTGMLGAHTVSLAAAWVVPATGGTPQLLVDYPGFDNYPTWSPDGLAVALFSEGPSGVDGGVFTVARDSIGGAWKEPVRLTDFSCGTPVWSPDGRRIACADTLGLVLLTPTGEVISRLANGMNAARPHFSADGTSVFFLANPADGPAGVWSIPVSGGAPRLRVEFDDPAVTCCFDLTLGRDRVYLTVSEYESDIWVMDLKW